MHCELDPTINAAVLDHVKSDPIAKQLDIVRLQAALAADINPLAEFKPPEGASKGSSRCIVSGEPGGGTCCKAVGDRPPVDLEGGRARDNRGDNRQAWRNDPAAAGARERSQVSK
jgi:hypothetical protein